MESNQMLSPQSFFKSEETRASHALGASRGGKIAGTKNRANGHWARISQMVDRVAAAEKAGQIAVESGQVYEIQNHEASVRGGKTQGKIAVQSGQWEMVRPLGLHNRWHVTGTTSKNGNWIEAKPSPKCSFCIAKGLIKYV
jgi:hypothetical protein